MVWFQSNLKIGFKIFNFVWCCVLAKYTIGLLETKLGHVLLVYMYVLKVFQNLYHSFRVEKMSKQNFPEKRIDP